MTRAVRRWITWTAVAVGLGLLIWGLIAASGTVGNGSLSAAPNDQDHIKGALTAPVVIVEYGDFQCPACGTYQPVVNDVEQHFGDKVAVVFREFPLTQIHNGALVAAQAAEAASLQGKFWEFHDLLYERQSSWPLALDLKKTMVDYAKELGLDTTEFTNDLESQVVKDRVQRDVDSGNASQVLGTPTFFINGQQITNPTSSQAFIDVVNNALKNT